MKKPQYVESLRQTRPNRVQFDFYEQFEAQKVNARFDQKAKPLHIQFGAPAKATGTDKLAESKPAKEEAPKKVDLWSPNFMKQNQEHQKKVQDLIDELEKTPTKPAKKATKPSPSPLTASTASSPFSFGLTDNKPASTAASSAPAFTFGKNPTCSSNVWLFIWKRVFI